MRKALTILLIIAALLIGGYVGFISGQHGPVPKGPILKITFLRASLGGGVIVKTPENRFTVIDPGAARTSDALVKYLNSEKVKTLDILITNPTSTNSAACNALMRSFRVRRIMSGEKQGRSRTWRRVIANAERKGISMSQIVAERTINLSNTTELHVLAPPQGLLQSVSSESDDNSLVFKITFGRKRFLFTSEITERGEAWLVKSGSDVESDVLIVPRSGHSTAASLELLSKVRPDYCVITSSNTPNRSLLERLNEKNTGARLFRTDKNGTISIVSDGRTIAVITERDGRD
ncbi:MAG: hypothetical protein ABFD54_02935 [Armatimonadota bacterium]|nr:hypothetical protein [bacterium]